VTSRAGPELVELIGEAALVRLAEAFGGTRLYVPQSLTAKHAIVRAIGPDAARSLVERLAPDVIKVPLARELRARHYRAENLSDRDIARKLGITESGVEKLFARVRARGEDDRQPGLFDTID
jgi:hypothetical protein